jgi:ABC-type glutathione transport system ATPase component
LGAIRVLTGRNLAQDRRAGGNDIEMSSDTWTEAPLLEVRGLTVAYQDRAQEEHIAIHEVELAIHPGEVLGVLGESGCGKTTLALALLGLLPESATIVCGSVFFQGREIAGLRDGDWETIRGAEISLVAQDPSLALCPVRRIGKQVADVVQAHRRWTRRECDEEAARLLKLVHLDEVDRIFSRYPSQLSGGQLQRVVIAQAIACGPQLMIADEPTSALDTIVRAEILDLLQELRLERKMAMLLISHEPEILGKLADRIVVMHEGGIIEAGDFEQLRHRARMPFTRELMGAMRAPRGEKLAGMGRAPSDETNSGWVSAAEGPTKEKTH